MIKLPSAVVYGEYKYYDMDDTIAAAMELVKQS